MRITIERLRTAIVIAAVLVVGGIVGFLVLARYQRRFLGKDLPDKLGIHIQQSGEGYTYSQNRGGKTLFVLKAAKYVQFKDRGRITLHDVSITLYGAKGDRNDRIYGADFEYDPSIDIVQAQGEVQIDLGPANPNSNAKANTSQAAAPQSDTQQEEKSTVHVKTSGLSFNQKTGVATTDQVVEFHFPKAAGTAKGARYESENGLLVLNSAVEMNTSLNGDGLDMHASHAQLLREAQQCYLLNVSTDYRNERSTADEATVHFRKDGSAELVEAKGNVHLRSDSGQELTSQAGEMHLDERSQPKTAHLSRGVLFNSNDPIHHMHGTAVEAYVDFAGKSAPKHARLLNAVSFVDQQSGLPGDPQGSLTREVRGSQVDIDFRTDDQDHTVAQKAVAQGNASVVLHTIRSKGPQQNTTIEADTLLANFTPQMAISDLSGTGHSRLVDLSADGTTQVSTGDSLSLRFNPQARSTKKKQAAKNEKDNAVEALDAETAQIQSAIQTGHVTLTQQPPKNKKNADGTPVTPLTASADRAEYQAVNQVLHLTGSPRVHDGGMDLTAQIVDYYRSSGDARAYGNVQATYLKGTKQDQSGVFGAQGPLHIVSSKVFLEHATGNATFSGQAKLWQDTNSISAPVIDMVRLKRILKARTEIVGQQVNSVFLSKSKEKQASSVIRITSRDLTYSDGEKKGTFQGNVVAQNGDTTIRSTQSEVYLADAPAPSTGKSSGQVQGQGTHTQVDRLIANGSIVLSQPGRRATGEKLVYTAADDRFILTGTSSVLPHLYDEAHGNVTGDALIFNNRYDSGHVEGQGQQTVTHTRTPK
jgi:lipopolysaccharide export system protein LptA